MRTGDHVKDLELRLQRVENALGSGLSEGQPTPTEKRIQEWLDRLEATLTASHSDEMTALDDMRAQLNRQLAVQGDRLASLNLKLDMTHSRVERVDRVQDEVRQTQDEHEATLTEILDRLPHDDHVG
ncbi:MAG: hypothetical protein J2P25_25510 [Nocardiopsaceae bacterium]|nr:hypothetical protein [Nocardiopsaceae bacterium]